MKRRNASAKLFDSIDVKEINMLKTKIRYAQSIINLTHILLSSLHVWSIDKSLDKLFSEKLELKKPKYPIAFGRISRGSHFFVMFPQKKSSAFNFVSSTANQPVGTIPTIPKEKSMNLINFDEPTATTPSREVGGEDYESRALVSGSNSSQSIATDIETPSPSVDFWLASKVITTEHLVTILAISNAFMNLQSFIDLQIRKE